MYNNQADSPTWAPHVGTSDLYLRIGDFVYDF